MLLATVLVLCFVVVARAAPVLPIDDPTGTNRTAQRKAPSAARWLGIDEIGRDLLGRRIWGARAALLAGVVLATLSAFLDQAPWRAMWPGGAIFLAGLVGLGFNLAGDGLRDALDPRDL